MVKLASAVTVPVDITALAADAIPDPLPPNPSESEIAEKQAELAANPIANAAKASLSTGLGIVEPAITITSLSVSGRRRRLQSGGGIAVNYIVSLPLVEATSVQ